MVEKMQVEQALQGIDQVLKEVRAEREKQIKKVGTQDHDPHWWLAILAEETGEVAKEITEARLGNWDAGKYREELVQVAAVAVAAIQVLDDGVA